MKQLEKVKNQISKILISVKPNLHSNIKNYLLDNNKKLIDQLNIIIEQIEHKGKNKRESQLAESQVKGGYLKWFEKLNSKRFLNDIDLLLKLYKPSTELKTVGERVKYIINMLNLIENDNIIQIIDERIKRLNEFKKYFTEAGMTLR